MCIRERAGALVGTPIERLQQLNRPAYEFYLERNPRVDLATEMLEVDVCAQHNNGGLVVDAWWQSNVAGFFPVGEAAGAHGVYRPCWSTARRCSAAGGSSSTYG